MCLDEGAVEASTTVEGVERLGTLEQLGDLSPDDGSVHRAARPNAARPAADVGATLVAHPLRSSIGSRIAAVENASVRVSGGPPLCGPAFPQVGPDRQGRSYVA